MTTWHQAQALKRQREAQPFVNPFQHATLWTVVHDPLNGMASVTRYEDREPAYTEAATQPSRFVVPPRSVK